MFSRGESDRTKLSQEILDISDFVEDFIPDNISSTEIRSLNADGPIQHKLKETVVNPKEESLEGITFGTCVMMNNELYKLIERTEEEYDSGKLECKLYNGEEFIFVPYGTRVVPTGIKVWPTVN